MALWNPWFDIFNLKNPTIFPIPRLCVGGFSKIRQESAVVGSHKFRKAKKFQKSWPKSCKSSPGIKNQFAMTLITGGAKSGSKAFECESKPIKSIPRDHTVNFYQSKTQKYCIGVKNATFEAKNWPKSGFSAMPGQKTQLLWGMIYPSGNEFRLSRASIGSYSNIAWVEIAIGVCSTH